MLANKNAYISSKKDDINSKVNPDEIVASIKKKV